MSFENNNNFDGYFDEYDSNSKIPNINGENEKSDNYNEEISNKNIYINNETDKE